MTATIRRVQRYGWVPDLPDHRDKVVAPPSADILARVAATPHVDLSDSPNMPEVWDQSRIGACTAHSVGAAYEFAARASGHPEGTPSRLFIYYHERLLEGTVDQDSGAMIRDGFKVLATVGVPQETDWPYDITKFADAPPEIAEQDAASRKATVYSSVNQDADSVKATLVSGDPVSFGFSVYESFESPDVARTGVVPMPGPSESVIGGHAVLIVGYDDPTQMFKVRNSWSTGWGQQGYFQMPYAYALDQNLANDFWVAQVAA